MSSRKETVNSGSQNLHFRARTRLVVGESAAVVLGGILVGANEISGKNELTTPMILVNTALVGAIILQLGTLVHDLKQRVNFLEDRNKPQR